MVLYNYIRPFFCAFAVPLHYQQRRKTAKRRPKASHIRSCWQGTCGETRHPPKNKSMYNSIFNFTTELCVDLKTILRSDRRAKKFKDYRGVLTRDGREHFTFIEDAEERKTIRRYPCVYKGYCFNVHRRDDGLLYLNFRQPQYTRFYTFRDFCREAAEELLLVVSLLESEE